MNSNIRLFLVILTTTLISGCMSVKHQSKSVSNVKYQYATFYMETQGDFIVPIGADDPAIYSWNEGTEFIKGDIPVIWKHLGINLPIEYQFNSIENILLNHVAEKGWILVDFEISSIPTQNDSFRTAYRYIFKKPK